MQQQNEPPKKDKQNPLNETESKLASNTSYPAKEDIYNHQNQHLIVNADDISVEKGINSNDEIVSINNELENIDTEENLDVPGAELDDKDEETGSEDEENNSYSIGGDNHNNLEEPGN